MYRPSPDSGGGGGGVRCKAGPSRLPPFSSTPQSQCPDLAPARTAGGGAPSQSSLGSVGRYGGLLDVILRPVPSCYCVKKGIKSEGGREGFFHARTQARWFLSRPNQWPSTFPSLSAGCRCGMGTRWGRGECRGRVWVGGCWVHAVGEMGMSALSTYMLLAACLLDADTQISDGH